MKDNVLDIEFGNAICYSGYREDQSPQNQTYPSYEEVCEDLLILDHNWQYLRVYDCSRHAELVLEAISNEGFDFRVMLGVDMRAEVSNPGCPWGPTFSAKQLTPNRRWLEPPPAQQATGRKPPGQQRRNRSHDRARESLPGYRVFGIGG